MAKRTVRVIKTYHVDVDAEYEDSLEDLLAKAVVKRDAKPDDETLLLMPEGADK